jgi:predicted PurR-regulated permease PerM
VNGLLRLVPPDRRVRVDEVLQEAASTVGLWLRARLISMCTIALLSTVGLALLRVPDALALGIISGLLAFVPNIGPIAAALPAVLIAATLGWERVVAVLFLYWLAHTIDDFFVIPFAERRVVRLPPVLTIAAQLVLGLAAGIIGVMVAAPFVAVGIVLVHRLVVEDLVERKREPFKKTS